MPDFQTFTIPINLALFAAAAAVVWFAGTRISFYADELSDRTGIGKAFMGLFFLALATEMPEIGTTVSASAAGNAPLAVNNLFGGIILQTVLLAIVDLLLIRGALTFFSPQAVLMLQGVQLTLLIALALAAIAAGETVTIFGVGLWSMLLVVAYFTTLLVSQQYERREQWQPEYAPNEQEMKDALTKPEKSERGYKQWGTGRLALSFGIGATVIFASGVVLSQVADALAVQSGLGASFVGATLLAASTSLPELSTAVGAVRLGNYSMAVSSIFGSNSIMIVVLFIADVFYRPGPILAQVDTSAIFAAAMGIVVTAVYLIGLVERRNQTVARVGVDSAVVLVLYAMTLAVLYALR